MAPPKRGPFAWFNRQFDKLTQAFGHMVVFVIRKMAIAFVLLAGFVALIVYFFGALPTSFVPNEDQGYVMTAIIMPDAASLDRAEEVTAKVDEFFAETPGVADRYAHHRLQPAGRWTEDERRHAVRDAEAVRRALRDGREGQGREREGRADERLREGPRRSRRVWSSRSHPRRSPGSGRRAASSSGCRTPAAGTRPGWTT